MEEIAKGKRRVRPKDQRHAGLIELLRVAEALFVPPLPLTHRGGLVEEEPRDAGQRQHTDGEVEVFAHPDGHVRHKIGVLVQQFGSLQELPDAIRRARQRGTHHDALLPNGVDQVVWKFVRHVHHVLDAVDAPAHRCPVTLGSIRMRRDLESVIMGHPHDLPHPRFR